MTARRPVPSDIEALVPLHQIVEVQRVPTAVYRVYDATAELLYIGMTVSPKRRMQLHSSASRWWHQAASIELEWHRSIWHARTGEIAAIHLEQPLWNKREMKAPKAPLKLYFAKVLDAVRNSTDPEAELYRALAEHRSSSGHPWALERYLAVGALDGSLNVPLASQKASA